MDYQPLFVYVKLKTNTMYMNLVLDLDETLISVTLDSIKDYDFKFKIQGTIFFGKKRPGLDLFLAYAFKHFKTVSVWTAATMDYAKRVINNIFTKDQISKLVFVKTRRDVSYDSNGRIYKPLKKIFTNPIAISNNINITNTVMVDDKLHFLSDNPGNGIVIPVYKGHVRDQYLPKLLIVLDGIINFNMDTSKLESSLILREIVE